MLRGHTTLTLSNISILSVSIFHREDVRLQNDDGAPSSAQRPFLPLELISVGIIAS